MTPRTLPAVALIALLAGATLTGCGGGKDETAAKPEAGDTSSPSAPPSITDPPSPTGTPTGPSGEKPAERRDALGGCPTAAGVSQLVGTTVTVEEDPSPTELCIFTSAATAEYDGTDTPVVQVTLAEPVGIAGAHTLPGYRRKAELNNPTAVVPGLGPGAFVAFVTEAPELCSAWFLAADGKILTASALDIRPAATQGVKAGPNTPSCSAARRVARVVVG